MHFTIYVHLENIYVSCIEVCLKTLTTSNINGQNCFPITTYKSQTITVSSVRPNHCVVQKSLVSPPLGTEPGTSIPCSEPGPMLNPPCTELPLGSTFGTRVSGMSPIVSGNPATVWTMSLLPATLLLLLLNLWRPSCCCCCVTLTGCGGGTTVDCFWEFSPPNSISCRRLSMLAIP